MQKGCVYLLTQNETDHAKFGKEFADLNIMFEEVRPASIIVAHQVCFRVMEKLRGQGRKKVVKVDDDTKGLEVLTIAARKYYANIMQIACRGCRRRATLRPR